MYNVAAGGTSYDELADHHRQSKEQYKGNIHQNEGRTAILPYLRRKSPDIAQTYGTSCRSQNHTQFAAKTASFFHVIL